MPHSHNRSAGLKVFFALLGAGSFLAFVYFLASLGPSEVVTDADLSRPRETAPVANARLAESRELISRFDSLQTEGKAGPEDIALLEQGLAGFEEVIKSLDVRDFGLEAERDRLVARIHSLRGRDIEDKANEMEKRATRIETENPDEALPLFEEALRLREQIRERYPQSTAHNPQKISALQRKVEFLQMRPLKERSLRLEAEGDQALEDNNWELAQARFEEAAQIQEYINVNSPIGQLGDLRRATALRDKEASVASGPLYAEIDSLTKRARSALEANLFSEAADLLQRAEIAQARLNREYPRSYYASREREKELNQEAADARSLSDFRAIVSAETSLFAALRSGKIPEAIDRIDQIQEQILVYRTKHHASTHPIAPIERRVSYLASRRNDLGPIQQAVYGQSIQLQGAGSLLMFRSEVPQWLYEIVTGDNPSREIGLNRPVESVTYAEATAFCESLGILLARPVRLPTIEEFELAVGNREETGKPQRVWSSQAGSSTPRPVATSDPNPVGFFDLLGNVEEWALARPSGATFTFGGTIRDLLSVINTSEPTVTARTERNRLIGFRFVIDTGNRSL